MVTCCHPRVPEGFTDPQAAELRPSKRVCVGQELLCWMSWTKHSRRVTEFPNRYSPSHQQCALGKERLGAQGSRGNVTLCGGTRLWVRSLNCTGFLFAFYYSQIHLLSPCELGLHCFLLEPLTGLPMDSSLPLTYFLSMEEDNIDPIVDRW